MIRHSIFERKNVKLYHVNFLDDLHKLKFDIIMILERQKTIPCPICL